MAMHPDHLSADELQYECLIRNIPLIGTVRDWSMALKAEIDLESSGRKQKSENAGMITTPAVELLTCQDKCQEVQTLTAEAAASADQELMTRALSKLIHLTGRLGRLMKRAPQLELTIERMIKNLEVCARELDGTLEKAKDVDVADQTTVAASVPTGAIPRTSRDQEKTSRTRQKQKEASVDDEVSQRVELSTSERSLEKEINMDEFERFAKDYFGGRISYGRHERTSTKAEPTVRGVQIEQIPDDGIRYEERRDRQLELRRATEKRQAEQSQRNRISITADQLLRQVEAIGQSAHSEIRTNRIRDSIQRTDCHASDRKIFKHQGLTPTHHGTVENT